MKYYDGDTARIFGAGVGFGSKAAVERLPYSPKSVSNRGLDRFGERRALVGGVLEPERGFDEF